MSEDTLNRLFHTAESFDASDIHLTANIPPYFRIGGRIVSSRGDALSGQQILTMLEPTFRDGVRQQYEEHGHAQRIRYRMHVYKCRGAMSAALRRIKLHIPSFKELCLPPVYERAIGLRPKGIIIVGGETGSGKSTTLASMVDYINARAEKHIVTVEDPIEYVLENKKSRINQRELGQDFASFGEALRAVVREDPDVILIGELRDSETVRAAIAAAETGHLVLTSLHTASAPETFNRILYFFPPHEEAAVRENLSSTLIAIMNQMLLPTLPDFAKTHGVKRVPATEVLVNNSVVREHIRDKEKLEHLGELLANAKEGDRTGAHDFNYALRRMCELEMVGTDTAIGASLKPEHLRMQFKGIGV
jgi:twitching motility protein PilT